MSVAARNWANVARTGSRAAKSVLLVLADAAAEKPVVGGRGVAHQCTLSQDTIARRSEASSRTVQRAMRTLDLAGHVLSKFKTDARGYRSCATFFLNVDAEAVERFVERCGITWRRQPPIRQNDGQDGACLAARMDEPTRQIGGASLNREMNRERVRANGRARPMELPGDWGLTDDQRRDRLSRYEVTDADFDRLVRRFVHHYRHVAGPRQRRHHNWLARFDAWCMRDLRQRVVRGELSVELWMMHLRGWRDLRVWPPNLGPAPDQRGCRAPPAAFDQVGLQRTRSAA
jgi:hypothetical protein